MPIQLSIAVKTIAGFVLLAIMILIVGIGGLKSIDGLNRQVQQVTDKNIPELSARFNQNLRISQANEALLLYLLTEEETAMQRHVGNFEARFSEFQHIVENTDILPSTDASFQRVNEVRNSLNAYHQHAQQIIQLHSQDIALSYQITSQLQKLQTKLETINQLSGKLTPLIFKDKVALQSLRKLMTSANQVRIVIRQYQLNGDIGRLQTQGERLYGQIQTEFGQFAKMEAKAKFLKQHIDQLTALIQPSEGLLQSYTQYDQLQKELAAQISGANENLAITQTSSQQLTDLAISAAQQSRAQSNEVFTTTRTLITVLIIVGLIIAGVIGYTVFISIQKPLKRISKQLKILGEGDMSIQFDSQRKDEFGALGIDLNIFVKNLRVLLQQIVNKSEELEQTATNNTNISIDTTAAMGKQSEQLAATSESAEQLKLSVETVAEQVNATLQAIGTCHELTEQADRHVNHTSGNVVEQAEEISKVVEAAAELEKNSQQIDAILGTIDGIADQTNLLALNAAIEAARAGEHGRGFAVVADEVRALASRTQNSTAEIQDTVQMMKAQIERVTTALKITHSSATQSVELANTSSQSLKQLREAIASIQEVSQQINVVTVEQSATVLQVDQNLTEINKFADYTANSAKTAEQSSRQLLEISHDQHSLTNKFIF